MTNQDFSNALGRALHRPAFAPVPAFAMRLLYGDMAEIVTKGQRAVPARALAHGFAFRHPDLDEALREALGRTVGSRGDPDRCRPRRRRPRRGSVAFAAVPPRSASSSSAPARRSSAACR